MNATTPALRDPLARAMLAAWVNCAPEQLPAAMRAHTCAATMEAWQRVGRAALDYFATTVAAHVGDGVVAEVVGLARRDIAREQTDFLGRMAQALCTYEGIFDEYPDGDLPQDAQEEADDHISALAGLALAQLVLLRHPSDGTDPAAALARPRAAVGDDDVGLVEAARDLLNAHKRLGAPVAFRVDLWACLEANLNRLAPSPSAEVEARQ